MPRIALIHALAHSPPPINAAMAEQWPEAERMNLLDDSLSADLARRGRLDETMTARFLALADYAVGTGAQAILFTCSAFGPCIEAVKRRHAALPVLKPNEAMIDEAVARARAGSSGNPARAQPADAAGAPGPPRGVTAGATSGATATVGLVASFAPTLVSMPPEFPSDVPLRTRLAEGAMAALDRGDGQAHDAAVLSAARALVDEGCAVLALAQFSMARARPALQGLGVPVLTTPDSAIRKLRAALCA